MKSRIPVLFIYLFVFSFINCSKKAVATVIPDTVNISSYAPANPVLKGLSTNPLHRITVNIPAGNVIQKYRQIICSLNAGAVNNLSEIDVYSSPSESFSTHNLLGSIKVMDTLISIPINMNCGSGIYYIWLSGVLKDNAAVSQQIEVHSKILADSMGNRNVIQEYPSPFAKLSGFAVRRAGDDGVNTYRIPGIIQTDKGSLIAVYDIRYDNSNDLPSHINIGMSRSLDSGKTWQPMKVIMDMGAPEAQNGIGNPCILFDNSTRKIWVSALWSKGNHSIAGSGPGLSPDQCGQMMLVSSSDDGLSWTAPSSITPQVKNPVWNIMFQGPGSGITMANGTIVFPAQYWDGTAVSYSSIVYSKDHGLTWQRGNTGAKSNTTECQVVETTPGNLMLNMRDNRGSFRSVYNTADMGTTWVMDPTSYSALPDPVCQGCFIKASINLHAGAQDILFFCNPNSVSTRNNITVKASLDLGESWLNNNQLLIDDRTCFGYSCLTRIDNQTLGLLYEGSQEIYFVYIPVSDIIKSTQ